jgi:CMP-N-acetylneuraminic acid synthetase
VIAGLMLGRGGSVGFPGKNTYPVLGRPLMAYPLLACTESEHVDRVYLSTDSEELMDVGRSYGAEIIVRPPELATSAALGEDAYLHGYQTIKQIAADEGAELELIVCIFANAPNLTSAMLDEAIETLRADPTLDSAISVSQYNMWSPLRARRETADGTLEPFVPFETFGDPRTLSCDRDSQGDVWFADFGLTVVRPRCFENMDEGLLPQKWMGQRIAPIKSWGGGDVDEEWQIPTVEFWLRAHGVTEAEPAEVGS